MRNKRHGFTLVELSIVLVIIGLLIGGILVAQSMIQTAKITRMVQDLGKYGIAVNNFYLNYKYYPGDAPQFTAPGDGDGALVFSGSCAASPNDSLSLNESSQAWAHLSQAGMVDKNYVPYSPISCPGGIHASYNTSNLNGVVWPGIELESNISGYGKYSPILFTTGFGNLSLYLTLSPKQVIPLMVKMGGVKDNGTGTQTGLTNTVYTGPSDAFQCYTSGGTIVPCNSSTAAFGALNYYPIAK